MLATETIHFINVLTPWESPPFQLNTLQQYIVPKTVKYIMSLIPIYCCSITYVIHHNIQSCVVSAASLKLLQKYKPTHKEKRLLVIQNLIANIAFDV